MRHRHPGYVRAVTLLLPALTTAACGQIVSSGGGSDDVPPPAMTGGGSPPTAQASSGTGGGTGGSGGSTCDFSESNPTVVANERFQEGADVAVNESGEVAITGRFIGTLDLGANPALEMPQDQFESFFVAKLDACGKALWTREIPTDKHGRGFGVTFDGQGNVVVGGYSKFPEYDIVVSKLDPDGNVLWTRSFDAAGPQTAFGITTDASDDILITGVMTGDVTFDNGHTLHEEISTTAFIAKLSPAGDTIWAKSFAAVSQGRGIATDSEGNVIVTGFFEGTIDLGGGPLLAQFGSDMFLAKFTATGDHIWSTSFASAADSTSLGVAVDSADAVLFTGTFHHSVDLGGGPIPGTTHESTFLGKFSAAGEHVWSRAIGGAPEAYTVGNGIAVGTDDTVIVGGWFAKTLTLCGEPLVASGFADVFVAKFDASGACLTSQRFGGQYDDRATSVGFSPGGSAVLTGYFGAHGFDFNSMHVTTNSEVSLGGSNLFVGWATP